MEKELGEWHRNDVYESTKGCKQAVSTRKIVVKTDGKCTNERGSNIRRQGGHQTQEHSCDIRSWPMKQDGEKAMC